MAYDKKLTKLLKQVQTFLDDDLRSQKKHYDEVKETLKKLKKRSNALKKEIKRCKNDKERAQLEEEVAIIKLQRKKGIAILKDVKKAAK